MHNNKLDFRISFHQGHSLNVLFITIFQHCPVSGEKQDCKVGEIVHYWSNNNPLKPIPRGQNLLIRLEYW